MPTTRSQSNLQSMDSPQQEASIQHLGHSSPQPGRKATLASQPVASQSNVRKRNSASAKDKIPQRDKNEETSRVTSSKESLPKDDKSRHSDSIPQDQTCTETDKTKRMLHQPQKTTGTSKKQQNPSNQYKSILQYGLIFLLVLLLLVGFYMVVGWMYMYMVGWMYMYVVPREVAPSLAEKQTEFERNMQQMKQDFPMQEQNMWDMVEATVSSHLDHGSNPTRPIILLLGSLPDASDTTLCLVRRLKKILSTSLNEKVTDVTLIDGREYGKTNVDDAKLEVDERLKASFDNGQKVAVVLNLDALPPCSILLFHSYCENENARYMDVALIFTVTLDKDHLHKQATRSKPLNFKNEVAFQISEHLTRAWVDKCPKLPEEKVEAMLSRIANNVGIVNHERSPSC